MAGGLGLGWLALPARIGRVTGPYSLALIGLALVLSAWAFVLALLNNPPALPVFLGGALLELLLIGFAIGGIVQMTGTKQDFSRPEFVGYLLACSAILPVGFLWARSEKSRAGVAVIGIAFLVVPVLILRVQQVWAGPLG